MEYLKGILFEPTITQSSSTTTIDKDVVVEPKRYCSAHNVNPTAESVAKFSRSFFNKAEQNDTGDTIYINVRWVMMWTNNNNQVDISKIRSAHKALNEVFSAQNTSELDMLPTASITPWNTLIGNPNIVFLPQDSSKVYAEYLQISNEFSSTNPLEDAVSKGKRVDGVLNLYIGPSSGGILGQAELNSNVCYNLYSSIGSRDDPGVLSNYGFGKTVFHEIGHALGLQHPFTDTTCDNIKQADDIPEQLNPNGSAYLTSDGNGGYRQIGDNRYNDRLNDTNDSCIGISADTQFNEMATNLMDYGVDDIAIHFTPDQVTIMREFLQDSTENTSLTLMNSTDKSYSEQIKDGDVELVEGASTKPTTILTAGLTDTEWIYIGVGIGIFLLLSYILIQKYKLKGKDNIFNRSSKGQPKKMSAIRFGIDSLVQQNPYLMV